MNKITKILLASSALLLANVPATAEIRPRDKDATQTTDFDKSGRDEAENETFHSPGEITHQGGEAVYNAVCAGCHMPQGEGAVGAGAYPALANNELLASASYPIYLVIHGQKAMPHLGEFLDDQQIADVVNYIRSSFGNDFIEEYGKATVEEVAGARR